MSSDAYIVTDRDTGADCEHDADGSAFTRDSAEAFAAGLNSGKTEDQRRCIVLIAERPMREVTAPARGSGPVRCDSAGCRGHRERCLFGGAHTWSTWFDNGRLPRTSSTVRCHVCGGVCTAEEEITRPDAIRTRALAPAERQALAGMLQAHETGREWLGLTNVACQAGQALDESAAALVKPVHLGYVEQQGRRGAIYRLTGEGRRLAGAARLPDEITEYPSVD